MARDGEQNTVTRMLDWRRGGDLRLRVVASLALERGNPSGQAPKFKKMFAAHRDSDPCTTLIMSRYLIHLFLQLE